MRFARGFTRLYTNVLVVSAIAAGSIACDHGDPSASLRSLVRFDARPGGDPAAQLGDATATPTCRPIKPADPTGQSHTLDPFGQSFADPSRDADHDGRSDLFVERR